VHPGNIKVSDGEISNILEKQAHLLLPQYHKLTANIRAGPAANYDETVSNFDVDRVLRAPASGHFEGRIQLASLVQKGDVIATVEDVPLQAPFDGVLRGILHDGLEVVKGMKVGDLDPRGVPMYCYTISDKSLAVGGGVLETLLSNSEIRSRLRR